MKLNWKKAILFAVIVFCVGSWIGVGLGLALEAEQTTFIILVSVAAVATEALFWAVAIVFGISVYESRKKILSWVKSRLRIKKEAIK